MLKAVRELLPKGESLGCKRSSDRCRIWRDVDSISSVLTLDISSFTDDVLGLS